MKVAIVLKKTKHGLMKHDLYKSISELSSKSHIENICLSKKTSSGIELSPCIFHSHLNPTQHTTFDYCLEGLEDDAFCTEDFQVYDTCNYLEKKQEEKKEKFFNKMRDMLNKYEHHMSVTYRINDEFLINYEKRKTLLYRKQELEKNFGETSLFFENNAEYNTLSQLVRKAEETYFKTRANVEKIYDAKHQSIPKEDFIIRSTKDELVKVEKCKSNLDNWCNKNKSLLTKEHNEIMILQRQIDSLDILLESIYETPCVYIHKAIKALNEMYSHYKKDDRQDIQLQVRKMEADLEQCFRYQEMHKEFLKGKTIEEIMKKVEKEQEEARNEERKIKSRKFIQSVKQSSDNALIVKIDGSVIKDENEEKLIIGNMVQGRIEDEQWRNLRR
jgi:hypothetical protein